MATVENRIGIKPSFYQKIKEFGSRHLVVVISVGSLLVAVVAIPATIFIPRWLDQRKADFNDAVQNKVTATLKEPNGVFEKLDKLQASTDKAADTLSTLQPFIQGLVLRGFESASKLSPQALQDKLPAVANLIQVANVEKVHAEPQATANLSRNLLKASSVSPGYWPVVGQLISYRSVPASATAPSDKPCSPLTFNIDRETGPGAGDIEAHLEASDCTFDLDNNPFLRPGGSPQVKYLILRNARVRYRGGSVADLPLTIVFDHCTFDLRITTQPPVVARQLTNALLATSDLSNLSYNNPG
jgi:hypothetical protein